MERQSCPSCGAALHHISGSEWACDHCGNVFHHEEEVRCPECDSANPLDARYCFRCGANLLRRCPSCGQENLLSAEYCVSCGVTLDIVTVLMMRLQDREGESASRRAASAAAIKGEDEIYLEKVRRDLDRQERQRQAELAAMRIEAQRQQRILSTVMIVAGVVLVMAVAVTVILLIR